MAGLPGGKGASRMVPSVPEQARGEQEGCQYIDMICD